MIPSEKRAPFAEPERKRRHKTVTSVEFAGRWSLLRKPPASTPEAGEDFPRASDEAVETFARVLLRRYGIVFRRLLERESLRVSWYELGRVYRRLEARGEIRGGHFITGASGEQFALPEAIGLLRSIRRAAPAGELIVINAADPLKMCIRDSTRFNSKHSDNTRSSGQSPRGSQRNASPCLSIVLKKPRI